MRSDAKDGIREERGIAGAVPLASLVLSDAVQSLDDSLRRLVRVSDLGLHRFT
jgi:hypothetical protein